ncbi:MAG: hypothetical protein ABJM06_02320 [Gilvibacter sp.]
MKSKIYIFMTILALSVTSCGDDFPYQYAEQPPRIDCDQMNQAFLNEAMYSFQEDVAVHYNFRNYSPTTPVYYQWGFASYVSHGSHGTAPYKEIVSDQSILILKELVKEEGLFTKKDGQFELNYKHPVAACLIDKLSDETIKQTIQTLVSVDQMQARLLDEPLRKNIKRLLDDKHLVLFIGLSTYYPRLMNLGYHLNNASE